MKALVLAGGFPQIALIKELKRRGIKILLADYNSNPVAKEHADEFYQISTLDIDAITELARENKVDFLITACTDQALLTVAKVSEDLKLPCYIDYETALKVTNKLYMKKTFENAGIPTAKHIIAESIEEVETNTMKYPLVVKPVDCNSSKGVKKVYNHKELEEAFFEAIQLSRTKKAVIEEYIDGREISVDVQVEDGIAKVLSMSYSDKISDDDKFVIFRAQYPIVESETVKKQICDIAQQIANAFQLKNSPMLIQTICDGKNIYVLEFSARTGGGVKYVLIEKISGFDVISAVVDLTLNKKVHVETKISQSKFLNNVFLYCYPGKFDRLEGFDEMKNEGMLSNYYLFKPKGEQMTGVTNSGDRIAGFTIQADSEKELHEKYRKIANKVKVIDVLGNDILRRDLLGIPE